MSDVRIAAKAGDVSIDVRVTLSDTERAQRRYGKRLGDGLIDQTAAPEGASVFGDQPLLDIARYTRSKRRTAKRSA